ncbi:MAG: hypothetical protein ACJ8C4_14635 [Gemmataceae bacterium]
MTEYPSSVAQRRCSVSGRDLRPGERYYAVVLEGSSGYTRRDFATEAWNGTPEQAVGYWASRVPATDSRPKVIDVEAALDMFVQLETDPLRSSLRYVLALWLVRRKRLKLERSSPGWLRLTDAKSGDQYEIQDVSLSDLGLAAAQEEMSRVIYGNS